MSIGLYQADIMSHDNPNNFTTGQLWSVLAQRANRGRTHTLGKTVQYSSISQMKSRIIITRCVGAIGPAVW